MDVGYSMLTKYKSLSDQFVICNRLQKLTWNHHYEAASLKKTHRPDTGKWRVSDELFFFAIFFEKPLHSLFKEIVNRTVKVY